MINKRALKEISDVLLTVLDGSEFQTMKNEKT